MSKAGATRQTQGMSDLPEHTGFIAGLAGVIDTINAGSAGLPALTRLLWVAQAGLRAEGMSFAEYGPTGGRVIAATGAAEWALGRPLDLADPAIMALRAGPRIQDVPLSRLPEWLAGQLAGRGLFRVFYCRAELGSLAIGHVHAYYRDAEGRSGPEQQALIQLAAACAAHQYADSAGLPVHGDGPVVAALTDGLAIVDREGRVRLWNPAAEQVTGRLAAEMLGRPLPFPVPHDNEVVEHELADGRWLKITAGVLPGTGESRVVTFSDATEQHRRDARPGAVPRGDGPRAAYAGHRHQGVRGHARRPLGGADASARPAGGGCAVDRPARRRAGPAGGPAARRGDRRRRGGRARRPSPFDLVEAPAGGGGRTARRAAPPAARGAPRSTCPRRSATGPAWPPCSPSW